MYICDTITETFVVFYHRDVNSPNVSHNPHDVNHTVHSYSAMETMEHDVMKIDNSWGKYGSMYGFYTEPLSPQGSEP